MAERTGERTERPTAKRVRDARERGEVARSRDLASAVSLAAVTLALGWFGAQMVETIGGRLSFALTTMGDGAHAATVGPALVASLLQSDALLVARVVGPPALIGGLASLLASVAQVGWVFAPKAIEINWERLNPASGLGRLKPLQGGAELVKALFGMATVGAFSYVVLRAIATQAPGFMGMMPVESARFGGHEMWTLLWRVSLALVVLAGADYGLQRWRWLSSHKMTRHEVREEARHNEGSPEMKMRVRRIQREMARNRMLKAVKTATVVVTNPTHFAVALEYRRNEMAAPVVVAKGQDHMAARIRAVAREHGVPIVENVTLARTLYKTADIGDTIPADLFGAVAEVLAYLVRLKQLML